MEDLQFFSHFFLFLLICLSGIYSLNQSNKPFSFLFLFYLFLLCRAQISKGKYIGMSNNISLWMNNYAHVSNMTALLKQSLVENTYCLINFALIWQWILQYIVSALKSPGGQQWLLSDGKKTSSVNDCRNSHISFSFHHFWPCVDIGLVTSPSWFLNFPQAWALVWLVW